MDYYGPCCCESCGQAKTLTSEDLLKHHLISPSGYLGQTVDFGWICPSCHQWNIYWSDRWPAAKRPHLRTAVSLHVQRRFPIEKR